jgi:hypothetical protein
MDAYLDGELNIKAAAALDEHLKECPDCAAQVEEARELLALVSACDDVQPDAALHESVMRSVREQPRRVGKPAFTANMRRWGGALAGVCLLLAVLLLPPVLLRGNAQEPSYDKNHSNSSPQGPSMDGNGGGWFEDIFGDSSNKEECPSPSIPNESPGGAMDSAPDAPNGGEGESGLSREFLLIRMDEEGEDSSEENTTLWESLDGEWKGERMGLVIDTETGEILLMTEKSEYCGTAKLNGTVLTMRLDNGERLTFEVRLEGNELWLTMKS